MANLNRVILLGRLVNDPELKNLPSGSKVASFTLASSERFKVQGEQREETVFIDCETFGPGAEVLAKFLKKGRPLFVEGKLRQDKWVDKATQQNRSKIVVRVESWQFVDSAEKTDENTPAQDSKKPAPVGKGKPAAQKNVAEDEAPF